VKVKVIKKEPEQYNAVQWNGFNRDDYTEFIKKMYWYDGIDAEYFDKGNKLFVINYDETDEQGKKEVEEMGWIVFDYELDILSNLEFKKKYQVTNESD